MKCKHCGFKGSKKLFVKHSRAKKGRLRVCQTCWSKMIAKRWADGVITKDMVRGGWDRRHGLISAGEIKKSTRKPKGKRPSLKALTKFNTMHLSKTKGLTITITIDPR